MVCFAGNIDPAYESADLHGACSRTGVGVMTNERHVDHVRRYYERNTALFARFGSRTSAGSVHRALWPPGVRSLDEALRVSHRLVVDELHRTASVARVVDFGCGVGGALSDLRMHVHPGTSLVGLTLSGAQAQLAARKTAGVAHIIEGNYLAAPIATASCDFVYSIEAFAHAPDADAYFSEAARLLRSGGRLVLIDDHVARVPSCVPEQDLLEDFRVGWGVPSIASVETLTAAAVRQDLHLRRDVDLTPWLRVRTLPWRIVAGLLRRTRTWWRRDPVLSATVGSIALQALLARRVIRYRCLVFERATLLPLSDRSQRHVAADGGASPQLHERHAV